MIEKLVKEVIENDDEFKEKVKAQMTKIMSGEKFAQALEDNVIRTVEGLDFEEVLYDLITEEDLFAPVIMSIKKRLKQTLL